MRPTHTAAGMAAVLATLLAPAAWGAGVDQPPRTVGELATWCRDGLQPWLPGGEPPAAEAARGAYCFAYVQARIDAQGDAASKTYCAPLGASHREVIEGFVIQTARASGDVQKAELWTGLDQVLRDAYPCDGTRD